MWTIPRVLDSKKAGLFYTPRKLPRRPPPRAGVRQTPEEIKRWRKEHRSGCPDYLPYVQERESWSTAAAVDGTVAARISAARGRGGSPRAGGCARVRRRKRSSSDKSSRPCLPCPFPTTHHTSLPPWSLLDSASVFWLMCFLWVLPEALERFFAGGGRGRVEGAAVDRGPQPWRHGSSRSRVPPPASTTKSWRHGSSLSSVPPPASTTKSESLPRGAGAPLPSSL